MARRQAEGGIRYRHELRSVAGLGAGLGALLRAAQRRRRPIILTEQGKPRGVLLDAASYAELREAALQLQVVLLGRRDRGRRRRERRR